MPKTGPEAEVHFAATYTNGEGKPGGVGDQAVAGSGCNDRGRPVGAERGVDGGYFGVRLVLIARIEAGDGADDFGGECGVVRAFLGVQSSRFVGQIDSGGEEGEGVRRLSLLHQAACQGEGEIAARAFADDRFRARHGAGDCVDVIQRRREWMLRGEAVGGREDAAVQAFRQTAGDAEILQRPAGDKPAAEEVEEGRSRGCAFRGDFQGGDAADVPPVECDAKARGDARRLRLCSRADGGAIGAHRVRLQAVNDAVRRIGEEGAGLGGGRSIIHFPS